jgi:3',5'-cyclic AMP phosphodiesterase CpdA
MNFRLAHFSDVHLGPVGAQDIFGDFRLKRLIGGFNWHARRKRLHSNDIADALSKDVAAARIDHVAFTGDLVNLASVAEFARGAAWLKTFGSAETTSFVPGNHDAYVRAQHPSGLGLLDEFMRSDARTANEGFPFVRLRRNIAIVGLSSAVPQRLWKAGGELGSSQRNALAAKLADLGSRGFFRVLLIHHPPLPGQAKPRKALSDAGDLQDILRQHGAELVIHGHNHRSMHQEVQGPRSTGHVIGVPSASMGHVQGHESAQWHIYDIGRSKGHWQTRLHTRLWDGKLSRFIEGPSRIMSHAK